MRADDGFEELRSVDAKAPVAAFRSDRQAMRRRSRRCVSQALRPDSRQQQPGQPLVLFFIPLSSLAAAPCLHPCRVALLQAGTMDKCESPLRALAAPPSTVAC